jgi:hypothetical protein
MGMFSNKQYELQVILCKMAQAVNTTDMYSGSVQFESELGLRLFSVFQANAGMVPQFKPCLLPSKSCTISHSLIFLPLDTI